MKRLSSGERTVTSIVLRPGRSAEVISATNGE